LKLQIKQEITKNKNKGQARKKGKANREVFNMGSVFFQEDGQKNRDRQERLKKTGENGLITFSFRRSKLVYH
jgi:hypothetical protein